MAAPTATAPIVERQTLSVEEAAVYLGISRWLAYKMAQDGRMPTVRLGARWVVPRAALDRLLESASERSDGRKRDE